MPSPFIAHFTTSFSLWTLPPPPHQNELCALCQLNPSVYSPLVAIYKENIREIVSEFFSAHLKEKLANYQSYVLDFNVLPDKASAGSSCAYGVLNNARPVLSKREGCT